MPFNPLQLLTISYVLASVQLHTMIYPLLQSSCKGAAGLPSSVPLGTTFTTVRTIWMQSRNERFQLDYRSWVDEGVEQCMGGVRYTFKTPNALIWTFNSLPQPFNASDCTLSLRQDGVLALELTMAASSSSPVIAWQTPTAGLRVQNLTLQDDGNLVLLDDSGHIVWQSFTSFHHFFLIPSGMSFFQNNMTLYDRVSLYSDYSTPGCYALQMGSQGRILMYTRANRYVYHSIGIDTSTRTDGVIPNYVVIHQNIEFYSRQGTLMGSIAHNVLNDDPLPNGTDLIGSALFEDGNLMINRPSAANPNAHLWYYNSSISNHCDFPLSCGEYGLCDKATRRCSCPLGFQIAFNPPACTAQLDDATRKCSCPQEFQMTKFNSTCIPFDPAYSLHPINVSFHSQPSAFSVGSQFECRTSCAQNASCNAALFDSNTSSCALFPILYTVALPSVNSPTGQVMFLKIPASKRSSATSTAIIVSTSVVGAALVLMAVLLVTWRRWHHRHNLHMLAQEQFLQELSKLPPRFSYKDLQLATNFFSKRLGRGGFGSVYEGVLNTPTGKVKVAVKRLDELGAGPFMQYAMEEQFKAEVATMGSVSHVNLVTLKGFCMEKGMRLLVFEFMPRGSLDRWLYTQQGGESSSTAACSDDEAVSLRKLTQEVLSWEQRCHIALDTAKGLEYLHHQSAEHIVHCDVKPANILLGEDFHAKVGDFGMAKLMGTDDQSFAMTTLKGTRGYLAPEWLQLATITAKSDVYSYGVVLLELLTGRRSLDPIYGHLPTWVMHTISSAKERRTEKSSITVDFDTIDASVLQDSILDENLIWGSVPTASFQRMLKLAIACVQADSGDRPTMATVVQVLEDILEISHTSQPLKIGLQLNPYSSPVRASGSSTTSCTVSSIFSELSQGRVGR